MNELQRRAAYVNMLLFGEYTVDETTGDVIYPLTSAQVEEWLLTGKFRAKLPGGVRALVGLVGEKVPE